MNDTDPETYYKDLINSDGILESLLYDLNLLPEQLDARSSDWTRMLIVVAHWKWMIDKHSAMLNDSFFAAQINGPSKSDGPY